MNYILNRFDQVILTVISTFLLTLGFLWTLVNIFHSNSSFLWFATVPIAAVLAYFWSRPFTKPEPTKLAPYFLLLIFLAVTLIFYLEPLVRYPFSTIGIPNKDLHDGVGVFINLYGHVPSQAAFILNSQNGLYLGYPNVLHVFSAFLLKLGAFDFHATWLAITITLLINSLAVFLLFKKMSGDSYLAAVTAGLFGLSSIRIPLTGVVSIPMLFSYSLLLPTLIITLTAAHQPHRFSWLIPALSISVLAASYTGTILVFGGLLVVYAGSLFISRDLTTLKNLGKLVLLSLPFLAGTLAFQQEIYWRNTFATARDFDPSELSQRFAPFDQLTYMLFYLLGLGSFLFGRKSPLAILLLAANLGLLLLTPLAALSTGLRHQEFQRLALLQPFFFIFFLTYTLCHVKSPAPKIILAVFILLLSFIIRLDWSINPVIQPELQSSFYNQPDKTKPYTLLSHLRLIVNDQIWSPEVINALAFLKNQPDTGQLALVDSRGWTEETIVDWGSIYLRRPLLSAPQANKWQKIFQEGTVTAYQKT